MSKLRLNIQGIFKNIAFILQHDLQVGLVS